MATLLPLSLPHTCTQDYQLGHYTIPANSFIVVNAWAIHRDPAYWSNPDKFDPMRFIDKDGKLVLPEALMPFGIGLYDILINSEKSNLPI